MQLTVRGARSGSTSTTTAISTSLLVGGAADRVYRNNLDGTFTESAQAMGLAGHADGRDAAFGDFDGDGRIDLVVAYGGDGVVLYRNSAGPAMRLADVTAASGLPTGVGARGVEVADYDNDGLLDLLIARPGGRATELWRGVAGGTFTRDRRSDAVLASLASAEGSRATFVDVDNDGALDLVVAGVSGARGAAGSLALLHNDGRGAFEARSKRPPGDGGGVQHGRSRSTSTPMATRTCWSAPRPASRCWSTREGATSSRCR